jgi:adenine-specific DNA-methyltransferase
MPIQKLEPGAPESQSANLAADNLAQLRALFPELVTEGARGPAINVDVLKALVGDATVTDADEKYGLNWHGKRAARQLALTPSTGTLRPCPDDSVDWDTTQNLMIEGDNLEVLKLLQKSYAGKVKLIYIDPPYNTGKDFVYPDNFHDSIQNYMELTGQVEGGRKISSNTDASGRFHTDWLNMLYPRLLLARNFLAADGLFVCSMDDCEAPRLRMLCDEVFGEENFLAQLTWRSDGNFDNQAKVKVCHEYVLLYAKDLDAFPHPPVVDPSVPADSKLFRPEIRNTIVKNGPKNPISKVTLPAGFPSEIADGILSARDDAWPHYLADAHFLEGCLVSPVEVQSGWSSKDLLLSFIGAGCNPILDAKGQETTFVVSKSGAIECIKRRSETQSHVISVLNGFGGPQKAAGQLSDLGIAFDGYPKPIELLQYLVQFPEGKEGVFLDFFAGSGTFAHAVMKQNIADGGRRRFVLVQLPEPLSNDQESQKAAAELCAALGAPRNIAEIAKERVRRAGAAIKRDNPQYTGEVGFRALRLDSSNIRAWSPDKANLAESLFAHEDHIVRDRREDDVLYELLLKLGLDLCVPTESKSVAGKTVKSIGGGVLLACLDEQITVADAEPLALGIVAWHREQQTAGEVTCVFRDSAFENDVAKTNLAAILEQHGIAKVRSL